MQGDFNFSWIARRMPNRAARVYAGFWHGRTIFSKQSASDRSGDRAWGEDILDQSLVTLWHPGTWDDVEDDELVLLNPVLLRLQAKPDPASEDNSPTVVHTRNSRLRPIVSHAIERQIAVIAERYRMAPNEVAALASSPATSDGGDAIDVDVVSPSAGSHLRPTSDGGYPRRYDLHEVAGLRALAVFAGPFSDKPSGARPDGDAMTLADAFRVSVLTRINTASVCSTLAHRHEMLSPGAWLGVIEAGRPALMPPFIADVERFREVLAKCLEEFDLVIVDLPPVEAERDIVSLLPATDSVLVAAEFGSTPLPALYETATAIRKAQGSLLGVVLTKADATFDGPYKEQERVLVSINSRA